MVERMNIKEETCANSEHTTIDDVRITTITRCFYCVKSSKRTNFRVHTFVLPFSVRLLSVRKMCICMCALCVYSNVRLMNSSLHHMTIQCDEFVIE